MVHIRTKFTKIISGFIFLQLLSCSTNNYAPVGNAWSPSQNKSGTYVVQEGDTLYAIAWRYNLDYRALAEQNHLSLPYVVKTGQILSIKPMPYRPQAPVSVVVQKKTVQTTTSKNSTRPLVVEPGVIRWVWPAKGRIIAHYSPSVGQKGVDIAGQKGEPILAAASGKIAYCGNGLRGYGNLIIIKHNDAFLSAYAHNDTLLVHEGDEVKAGKKIATMGDSESKRVMLHFEIREAGKSVNPLRYVKP